MDHFSFQAVILSGYVQHRDVDGTERSAPVQEAGVGQSRNGRVQVASFIPQNNADSIHLTKTILKDGQKSDNEGETMRNASLKGRARRKHGNECENVLKSFICSRKTGSRLHYQVGFALLEELVHFASET